jgi:hypothetical protein
MISKQTRKSQMPRNWSFLLVLIVVATFLESQSFPFTTTVADAQSEQSIERASPPVEGVEATTILAPLPEEVTELRQVVAKSNGRDSAPVEIQSKIQNPDKNIVRHFEDVVVTTPDFTFKAEAALQGNNWFLLLDPIEVEHNGRTFYSDSRIFIRQSTQGVEYAYSIHSGLRVSTDRNEARRIELKQLLAR